MLSKTVGTPFNTGKIMLPSKVLGTFHDMRPILATSVHDGTRCQSYGVLLASLINSSLVVIRTDSDISFSNGLRRWFRSVIVGQPSFIVSMILFFGLAFGL